MLGRLLSELVHWCAPSCARRRRARARRGAALPPPI